MRLFTLVCIVLASCTFPERASGIDEPFTNSAVSPSNPAEVCREGASSLETNSGSASEMVLVAVARTRVNDLRCGPPPAKIRVCRALLVLSVIDPATNLNNQAALARAHDALSWVLRDAASVAEDPSLVAALLQLDDLNHDLVAVTDDRGRAHIVQQRARPAILDPLDAAWNKCG